MVNGHKSAAHTDSPDGGIGKTCPGGGMHCPSASSLLCNKCSIDKTKYQKQSNLQVNKLLTSIKIHSYA